MRVDENKGTIVPPLGFALQNQQRVVSVGQQALRALLVQRRHRLLHRVDLGNEVTEVKTLGLRLVIAGFNDIEAPRPAVLEAHRHHHAGGICRCEGISLAIPWLDLTFRNPCGDQLVDQPVGIMALGKADRWCDVAEILVLLEQPLAFEIPPFDTVEQIVETGAREGKNSLLRRPQVLGAEHHLG